MALPQDKQKQFGKYTVSLEFEAHDPGDCVNGEYISSCFIEKGDYSASLEHLQHFGTLEDYDENPIAVSDTVQGWIIRWAEANGY